MPPVKKAFAAQEELNKETPVLRLRPTAMRFIPFILPVSPSFPDFSTKKDLKAPLQYGILRVVTCETICLSSICRSLHNLLSVRCVFKSRRSPRSVTFMPGNDLFRVVRIANLKLSTSQVASLLQNSSRSRGDVNRR